DLDKELRLLSQVPDGSMDPSKTMDQVTNALQQHFDDPIVHFLESTSAMTKKGNHYSIDRQDDADIPVDFKVPGAAGLVSMKSLSIGKSSFDLSTPSDLLQVDNINGLKLHFNVLGADLSSNFESIKEKPNGDGPSIYSIKASNPLPLWARIGLMAPADITVDLGIDKNGNVNITNQKDLKNQALGYNPFVRGPIDEIGDIVSLKNPSWSSVGNVLKDVAITALMFKGLGKVGLLLSPAVVHEVNQVTGLDS
ncbi:MAG: hypothetical protein ACRD5Z_25510, partial [Bryobacteraceae bacterium]